MSDLDCLFCKWASSINTYGEPIRINLYCITKCVVQWIQGSTHFIIRVILYSWSNLLMLLSWQIINVRVDKFYRAFHSPNSGLYCVMRVLWYNCCIGSPWEILEEMRKNLTAYSTSKNKKNSLWAWRLYS